MSSRHYWGAHIGGTNALHRTCEKPISQLFTLGRSGDQGRRIVMPMQIAQKKARAIPSIAISGVAKITAGGHIGD
jgi:hypothetical protein